MAEYLRKECNGLNEIASDNEDAKDDDDDDTNSKVVVERTSAQVKH